MIFISLMIEPRERGVLILVPLCYVLRTGLFAFNHFVIVYNYEEIFISLPNRIKYIPSFFRSAEDMFLQAIYTTLRNTCAVRLVL